MGQTRQRLVDVPRGEPAPLRLRLLGGFKVTVGDRDIPASEWRLRKAGTLLKLLALAPGHRLHREQVLDILWPDPTARAADGNLRRILHFARRVLDPDPEARFHYIALSGHSLHLCPETAVWVDVNAFEDAARVARRTRDPDLYRAAADLYTGDLLPEDLYEEWTQARRDQLRAGYLALLLALAQLHVNRNEPTRAVDTLDRIIAAEPTHEEAHAGLMRLYASQGLRRRALWQYEQLEHVLGRELDTNPDPATTRLYRQILAGDLTAPLPQPEPRQLAPRHNLSVALTSFVGREAEKVAVRRLLRTARLLTLTGSGGSGKTRLAVAVAGEVAGEYRNGVWLVDLAALSDPALVPHAVAGVLRVREECGRTSVDTLVEFLRDRQTLLILDNCEHLIQACSELAQTLLTSCPNLRILATSRQSLGVGGETRFRVPSLSVPARTVSVEECTDFEAVRLFVDRAVSREPAFALQPDNAGAIVEVCRRLDGIPLAIELAAARIDTLSPEQIAGRLDDALRLLTAGRRTAPPRQQTLRATLDWGYGLLDEREQRLLTRLSVFQGGWSLEAAEAVGSGEDEEAPDICSVLACLIDKSMVDGEPTSRDFARYRMLEPVRQYAWERLHRGQEADRVRRQHASLFLALAEQADCQLRGPEQVSWLERLEQEHDNLRTALSWAMDADPELGLRLAGALWWFWAIGGHVGEGRRFLERGLSLGTQAPTRARALLAAGMLAGHQGDHDLSTARFEESLTLNREVGDKRATAFALASLGGIAMERGDRPGGRALCDESLSLFREAGDRWGVAIALGFHLGEALLDRDSARIRSLHEEILALFREVGDGWSVAQTLTLGGRLLLELGEPEQAQEPPVDGLRTLWRMGTRYGLWESLDVLAAIAGARGEPSRAARLRGAAETEREAMGITLSSFDRSLYDRYLMEARAQLGPAAFDAALDEGRAMTLEQAVEYALRV